MPCLLQCISLCVCEGPHTVWVLFPVGIHAWNQPKGTRALGDRCDRSSRCWLELHQSWEGAGPRAAFLLAMMNVESKFVRTHDHSFIHLSQIGLPQDCGSRMAPVLCNALARQPTGGASHGMRFHAGRWVSARTGVTSACDYPFLLFLFSFGALPPRCNACSVRCSNEILWA